MKTRTTSRAISTHAPLAGRDLIEQYQYLMSQKFQPTRPLRGATMAEYIDREAAVFQPTRPLRGATFTARRWNARLKFQPTRPLRGATMLTEKQVLDIGNFNPRAPCGARRTVISQVLPSLYYFNPRAPCGARPTQQEAYLHQSNFNPRAPCGARPLFFLHFDTTFRISTHAPLAGRDVVRGWNSSHCFEFQPTRPLRGATCSVRDRCHK